MNQNSSKGFNKTIDHSDIEVAKLIKRCKKVNSGQNVPRYVQNSPTNNDLQTTTGTSNYQRDTASPSDQSLMMISSNPPIFSPSLGSKKKTSPMKSKKLTLPANFFREVTSADN
jgi:hypothetical protein